MADGRVTLGVDLNGVRFPTPVLGASGCFGSGQELAEMIDIRRVGGIITKSVTLKPVKGMPTPRMAETPSGMLNAIGLQNPGVEGFVAKDGAWIERAGVPVIVSVAGKSVNEFQRVAAQVEGLRGVVALEANISCPNVERRNLVFACDPKSAAEVVGAVARVSTVPVFAKLTPDVTDIVEVARACVKAGAHGLSIIGMGGIRSARDGAEFLLAGAWAVAVGTANFFNPNATIEVAQGLGELLATKGLRSPADLRGRMVTGEPVEELAARGG